MKLLTKTSIYFLCITAFLFLLNAIIIYQCIVFNFDKEANEHLRSEKNTIINNLRLGYKPEEIIAKTDKNKSIREITTQTLFKDKFETTEQEEEYEEVEEGEGSEEAEKIRVETLIFQTKVKTKIYEIKIASNITEVPEIGNSIINVVIICLICTLLILFIFNTIVSKFIWSPFSNTLAQIKNWNINHKTSLNFKKTNISEFKSLNHTLEELTVQIKTDFLNLKEFTENVSHEAQTPLAILSNKLELLLQEKNYTQPQAELLHQSYQAVQRLHKLNKALILLSRIDNKQFIEVQQVDLVSVVNTKLSELEDFIEAKKINIIKDFSENVKVTINPMLLNVLMDNLFNNAIKYNFDHDGTITIKVYQNKFSIENTSKLEKMNETHLFDRVPKMSNSNSLGIGLSLIKKITDLYGWQIEYSHSENKHKFKLNFLAEKTAK